MADGSNLTARIDDLHDIIMVQARDNRRLANDLGTLESNYINLMTRHDQLESRFTTFQESIGFLAERIHELEQAAQHGEEPKPAPSKDALYVIDNLQTHIGEQQELLNKLRRSIRNS